MNKEEIDKVLEELNQVNPSHLTNEALRLFNAIMSIADERDLYKTRINKAIEYIEQPYEYQSQAIVRLEFVKKILKGDSNE